MTQELIFLGSRFEFDPELCSDVSNIVTNVYNGDTGSMEYTLVEHHNRNEDNIVDRWTATLFFNGTIEKYQAETLVDLDMQVTQKIYSSYINVRKVYNSILDLVKAMSLPYPEEARLLTENEKDQKIYELQQKLDMVTSVAGGLDELAGKLWGLKEANKDRAEERYYRFIDSFKEELKGWK